MITTVVAASLLLTGQVQGGQGGGQAQPQVSPRELLSRMFARYAGAKSLVGHITLTASAMNQSGTLSTELQYEYPNKIYIRQKKNVGNGRGWLLVSDGKYFTYDAPSLPGVDEQKRLLEKTQFLDKKLGVKEIYATGAANLGDRSTALDILIARNEDLRFITSQWATMQYSGTKDYDGVKVHVIIGSWRQNEVSPANGQFRIYVTDEGDLRQFAKSEKVGLDVGQTTDVLFVWDVKAEVNGKVDPSLFSVK